ncbi:MAG TPA: hypothetical protein DDW20_03145 [Firmicutes bacterium]|nr:hypothetical protein [Bacillota bacterium]
MKIKDLPIENRPREKAKKYGVDKLNDVELLGIIISKGVKNKSALEISESLIKEYTNLFCLTKAKTSSLKKQFGLNEITSLKLEAIFELFYRVNQQRFKNGESVKNADDVYKKYMYLSEQTKELLVVLMLDNKHRIIREKILYVGTDNFIPINIREIAVELLQTNTKYFLLIHNHPNNNKKPSDEDIGSTLLIKNALASLGLIMIDHIIITSDGFFSFRENRIFD